jgi:hypothetical protein
MLVECVRITNKDTGEDLGTEDPWLRVGQRYTVLAIVGQERHPYLYLLHSTEEQMPVAVLPSDCRIISNRVSRHWVVNCTSRGTLELIPEPWIPDSFWEDYDEGSPEAKKLYERIRKLLETEESHDCKTGNVALP